MSKEPNNLDQVEMECAPESDPESPDVKLVSAPLIDQVDPEDPKDEASSILDRLVRDLKRQTLFEEIHSALNSAFLMFCLPDLKAMAIEGRLSGDPEMIQRIIQPPNTLYDIATIYKQNKSILTEEKFDNEERAEMYERALQLSEVKMDEKEKEIIMKNITCAVLDDLNAEEECVYVIWHSPFLKRINVSFRGSVTPKDFKQDAKAFFAMIDNPAKKSKTSIDPEAVEERDLPDRVGIHLGFKEYLYGTAADAAVDGFVPKYKVILDHVARLAEQHSDFDLKIVGHSLGGALTSILAFEAAGDDRIKGKITAITCGSPKVGNLDFQSSFHFLEEIGRIRCIQVANNLDPVTKSPPVGNFDPCGPCFCRNRIFRHAGLRLMLVPKGFVLWHPVKATSYPAILVFDLLYVMKNIALFFFGCIVVTCFCNVFVLMGPLLCCCGTYYCLKSSREHHTQLKYIHRLEHCREELNVLYLDDLNEKRFGRSVFSSRVLAKCNNKKQLD